MERNKGGKEMRFSELMELINTYQSLERMKREMENNLSDPNLGYIGFSKDDLRTIIKKIKEMGEMEVIL